MTWKLARQVLVAVASVCLCLSGCVTQPDAPPVSAGGGSGLTAQPDGGPMLWPTEAIAEYGFEEGVYRVRSGFVSSAGKRLPDQYLSYAFCRDSAGNPTRVAAAVEGRVYVLSLAGDVLLEVASGSVATELYCFADRILQVVEQKDASASGTARLYDLDQGKQITVPKTLQGSADVSSVDAARYFAQALVSGSGVVPAQQGKLYGYRDLSGSWVKKPSYDSATEFAAGKALVSADGVWSVVDAQFKPEPQTYASAEPLLWNDVTVWLLSSNGLLKAFFSDTFEQLTVWEEMTEFEQWGEWVFVSGQSSIFNIATRRWLDLPSGFQSRPGEFAISPDGRQVFSYLTAEIFDLPAGLTLLPVEQSLLNRHLLECVDRQGYPVLLSVKGKPLPGTAVISWEGQQAAGGIYYWARVGTHRGLLNADGQWIYQESRFTTLED
ncbi:MAG: WG repeat-containing protein [Propionibacteriaceae bacterium]|jgi:hypothetical protein|nr:WG repeat-containing protein [Propionibacteriaceae bacterium]